MRLTLTVALSRHSAPEWLTLSGLELLQLRKVSDLAYRVFVELAARADLATGHVETSYAVLIALCSYDRAPCAHATPMPTQKRIRTAVAELVDLRLIVHVNRKLNERHKGLFFELLPRPGRSASDRMKGRLKGRPETAEKPALARVSGRSTSDEGQTEGQGVQEFNSSPLPPSLSTDQRAAVERMKATADTVRRRRAGGSN